MPSCEKELPVSTESVAALRRDTGWVIPELEVPEMPAQSQEESPRSETPVSRAGRGCLKDGLELEAVPAVG